MSITIAEILKLPSLHEARVVAGARALDRWVSTISVSEYTWTTQFEGLCYDYADSELVISAFYSVRDDVDKQCESIQAYHSNRVAGLILFYVGLILPVVDSRVISLADRLNFPVIVMPEGRPDLRYSEVIYEVVEAIIKNRAYHKSLKNDVIEQVSSFPASRRSVGFAMRILSNNTFSTIILADVSGEPYHVAIWPADADADAYLTDGKVITDSRKLGVTLSECRIYLYPVRTAKGWPLQAIIYKRGDVFSADTVRQIGETVQTAINLWGESVGENLVSELIGALLRDEPYKMRRLAALFSVEMADVRDMWIIRSEGGATEDMRKAAVAFLSEALPNGSSSFIADVFEGNLVVLFVGAKPGHGLKDMAAPLMDCIGGNALCTLAWNLGSPERIRRAYVLNEAALDTACMIYPRKRIFALSEIRFADRCIKSIERGGETVAQAMEMLDAIPSGAGVSREDMLATLSAYYLDTAMNSSEAAAILFVHKNTVQYRVKRFRERFADDLADNLELGELTEALAIHRILESNRAK